MREAAKNFDFERAAALRDRVRALKQRDLGAIFSPATDSTSAAPPDVPGLAASASAAAKTEESGAAYEIPSSVVSATKLPSSPEAPSVKKRSRAAKVSRKS
jgi:hypothetical protein